MELCYKENSKPIMKLLNKALKYKCYFQTPCTSSSQHTTPTKHTSLAYLGQITKLHKPNTCYQQFQIFTAYWHVPYTVHFKQQSFKQRKILYYTMVITVLYRRPQCRQCNTIGHKSYYPKFCNSQSVYDLNFSINLNYVYSTPYK